MSDTAVATPAPVEQTPEASLDLTTLEHDGRVFTGSGTDEEATAEAFKETTVGRKAELPEPKADESRPTRGQRRFSQLTSERDKAKAEADALRAEIAALKTTPRTETPAPKVEAQPEPKKTEPVTAKVPELEDFLNEPDPLKAFNAATRAYLEAQVDAKIEATLTTRLEAERASRELTTTVADLWERGRAAYTDFEAVVSTAKTEIPDAIMWEISHDPNAEHIYYALASDEALAKEVASVRDGLTLGRILGRLGTTGTRATPASPSPVVTSKAPRPFQPVSGASRTTSPSAEDLAEAGDYERYKAKRHTEMGIKAR